MDEPDNRTDETPEKERQVSEVSGMTDEPAPIAPEDATAGYPDSESGEADEGPAGPNAVPDHGRSEPENR